MKTTSLLGQLLTGLALAVLSFGIGNVQAASAPVAEPMNGSAIQSPQFQTVTWEQLKVEKLQHAYYLLEHSDADYNGHKLEAMHSVKKAAEVLGVDLHGHGHHEEEDQWRSDRKVNEARGILESLIAEGGEEQPHIHRAINELNKALSK